MWIFKQLLARTDDLIGFAQLRILADNVHKQVWQYEFIDQWTDLQPVWQWLVQPRSIFCQDLHGNKKVNLCDNHKSLHSIDAKLIHEQRSLVPKLISYIWNYDFSRHICMGPTFRSLRMHKYFNKCYKSYCQLFIVAQPNHHGFLRSALTSRWFCLGQLRTWLPFLLLVHYSKLCIMSNNNQRKTC